MRGLRSHRGGEALFGSAGWLFADLMLALVMMLVLTALITAPDEPASRPASASPTITTTTPPTTTTTTPPPRLLPEPVKLDAQVDADALLRNDSGAINALRANVQRLIAGPLGGRRAGIVLTFGPGTGGNIQRGVDVARRFNEVLGSLGGQFTGSAFRSYFQTGDPNLVTFEIFVFDR